MILGHGPTVFAVLLDLYSDTRIDEDWLQYVRHQSSTNDVETPSLGSCLISFRALFLITQSTMESPEHLVR